MGPAWEHRFPPQLRSDRRTILGRRRDADRRDPNEPKRPRVPSPDGAWSPRTCLWGGRGTSNSKQTHLDIAELDERIKASKRRCIEDGLQSLERCGLPIDDRDKMRAKDCINSITFGQVDANTNDPEICVREVLNERGVRNSTMDSRVGKVAKQLYLNDHPEYVFPKKTIQVNGQMLPANVWYASQRAYVERALDNMLTQKPTQKQSVLDVSALHRVK